MTSRSNKSGRDQRNTHNAPPAAGPIALNKDIAVIEMPLAAPLWCCFCFQYKHVKYATDPLKTTFKLLKGKKENKII